LFPTAAIAMISNAWIPAHIQASVFGLSLASSAAELVRIRAREMRQYMCT
jgi:hypothetical protein